MKYHFAIYSEWKGNDYKMKLKKRNNDMITKEKRIKSMIANSLSCMMQRRQRWVMVYDLVRGMPCLMAYQLMVAYLHHSSTNKYLYIYINHSISRMYEKRFSSKTILLLLDMGCTNLANIFEEMCSHWHVEMALLWGVEQ